MPALSCLALLVLAIACEKLSILREVDRLLGQDHLPFPGSRSFEPAWSPRRALLVLLVGAPRGSAWQGLDSMSDMPSLEGRIPSSGPIQVKS